MTSMDINAVATKTVKNFLTYENSFAQIQKGSIIMPHYFWYITGRKKYTKNDTWQTKNMESASNTDCSILRLSMQWCVILFLEICCTIWSKKNVVLLKRQWNIITERFFWKGSREDNVKAGKKNTHNMIIRLRVLSLWTLLCWRQFTTFFSPSWFLENTRGEIILNASFLEWDEQHTMPYVKTTVLF